MFKGDLVTGPGSADYQVPALTAGTYPFVCTRAREHAGDDHRGLIPATSAEGSP